MGKININQNLLYSASGALDSRFIVDSIDKIENISNAYVGLEVYVVNSENNIVGKYKIKKINNLTKKPLPANEGGYELIRDPKDLLYSDGTPFLNNNGYVNSDTKLIEISDKIDKLPTGIYYGQYSSEENLPEVSELDQKGYAYVASSDPTVYYIYLYNGTAWEDSGNKFVTTELESNLTTKSQTKAPTTKAVVDGIEAIDVTLARSAEDENELTKAQKYNASANINDRAADVDQQTNEVKALGYKVLNPSLSFTSQVTEANTVYEIKNEFSLDGSVTIPVNCVLKFNGGKLVNGTIVTNNCEINSIRKSIFGKNVSFSGTFKNDIIDCSWFEFISMDDEFSIVENQLIKNDNPTDNLLVFKQIESVIGSNKTILFPEKYFLQTSIETPNYIPGSSANKPQTILRVQDKVNVTIDLNGSIIKLLYTNSVRYTIFSSIRADVVLKNGTIYGNAEHFNYPNYGETNNVFDDQIPTATENNDYEWHWGIDARGGKILIENMELGWFCGSAVMLGGYKVYTGTQDDYVPISYEVNNVYVHHCGRGAFGGLSCISGEYNNITVDMCGMPSSTSGIMPRNPRTAFGIEFEDLYLAEGYLENPYPILLYNNIKVTNVYKIVGSAVGYSPNDVNGLLGVKKVSFTNSYLQGTIMTVNTLSTGSFYNCTIDIKDINATDAVIFDNCIFKINATSGSPMDSFRGYIRNSTISEYVTGESEPEFIFQRTPSYSSLFENVAFKLSKIELGISKFINCDFNPSILTKGFLTTIDSYLDNCTLNNYNIYGLNSTQFTTTIRRSNIISCSVGHKDYQKLALNCVSSIFSGNSYIKSPVTMQYDMCNFNNFKITALEGSTCTIKNCTGEVALFNNGNFNIRKSYLKLIDYSTSYPAFNITTNLNIQDSTIDVIGDTSPISSQTPVVVATNTRFIVGKNYKTDNMQFTNCIVESSQNYWKELTFRGTANTTVFSVPIPKKGTTASRPALSATHVAYSYFDTTLGKPIYWNGSAWIDGNGEAVGLQVSDTSVLIGAAAGGTNINVYHANALNVTALNPDNTPATWLTVPSTIAVGTNTLTITAAANEASNPRGAKVIIEDGTDVVIVNVVQNYSTT